LRSNFIWNFYNAHVCQKRDHTLEQGWAIDLVQGPF